jgi:hypothetical protein
LSREPKIMLVQVIAAGADSKIRLECQGCRRTVVMSAQELADKWGPHLRLDVIERRGRCAACGSRDVKCRPEYPAASGAGRM